MALWGPSETNLQKKEFEWPQTQNLILPPVEEEEDVDDENDEGAASAGASSFSPSVVLGRPCACFSGLHPQTAIPLPAGASSLKRPPGLASRRRRRGPALIGEKGRARGHEMRARHIRQANRKCGSALRAVCRSASMTQSMLRPRACCAPAPATRRRACCAPAPATRCPSPEPSPGLTGRTNT